MKPIIMSGASVKATLEERKHQTRQVVKLSPHPTGHNWGSPFYQDGYWIFTAGFGLATRQQRIKCPYGQVGDRLYLKETWMVGNYGDASECSPIHISYRAGGSSLIHHTNLPKRAIILAKQYGFQSGKWKSSRFMPRWASRITLEITGVRVERIQEISPHDAIAEGHPTGAIPSGFTDLSTVKMAAEYKVAWFQNLWDSLNIKRGFAWSTNPWVWVLEYKRVEV